MRTYVLAGMELMANKFQVIVTAMRKKPYDFLDQRKAEFDVDFDDFKRQIGDLHVISLVQQTQSLCRFPDILKWNFVL